MAASEIMSPKEAGIEQHVSVQYTEKGSVVSETNKIYELEGDTEQTGKLVHQHAVTIGVGSDIKCILVVI